MAKAQPSQGKKTVNAPRDAAKTVGRDQMLRQAGPMTKVSDVCAQTNAVASASNM